MNKIRKIIVLIMVIIMTLTILASCKSPNADHSNEDFIEINENLYVHWINDIYTNTDEYVGKTIELKGMFSNVMDDEINKDRYYVFRVGPGCCANDGAMCGFEIQSDKDEMSYKEQQWIKVRGKLKTYEQGAFTYLYLSDCKITKMEKGENPNVSN